jgi:hypothetical protein
MPTESTSNRRCLPDTDAPACSADSDPPPPDMVVLVSLMEALSRLSEAGGDERFWIELNRKALTRAIASLKTTLFPHEVS